jgi:hypothetical protein
LPDDRYLRFYTIQYLYKLNSNDLWKNVLTILIKTEISSRDRKFFHNSKAYRIKQRVVQVLLMIACDNQYKVCNYLTKTQFCFIYLFYFLASNI